MRYAIIGGTGNTGRRIAEDLLKAGHEVLALARNPEKLEGLKALGAETMQGNASDAQDLKNAFAGADAAYLMVLPELKADDYYAEGRKIADAYVEALQANPTVKHIVMLSSVGAQADKDRGIIENLAHLEMRLNTELADRHVRILRAAYFMENHFGSLPTIKGMGTIFGTMPGDAKMHQVATQDIARVAADHLLNLDFSGHSHEYVLGQREVSMNEVAEVFSNALGKPVTYQQISYDQQYDNMLQHWGIGTSMANAYRVFLEGIDNGNMTAGVERNEKNTTPTSIEEFSVVYKHVYDQN